MANKDSKSKADDENTGASSWVGPVLLAGQVLWLVFDVGTMTIRLLFNTFIYDSPLGKVERAGDS